jgi:hypothetical protein
MAKASGSMLIHAMIGAPLMRRHVAQWRIMLPVGAAESA